MLSGDDFSLDINNPAEPKIICIANNPRRQSVYGTTLALMMSQLFKEVNVPGKNHCGILIAGNAGDTSAKLLDDAVEKIAKLAEKSEK